MVKAYHCLFAVHLLTLSLFVANVAANDYLTKEAEASVNLWEAERIFEIVSKTKATKTNILQAIDSAQDRNAVSAALNVADLDSSVFEDVLAYKLKLVFDHYHYSGIRFSSAKILARKEKSEGVKRLKSVLSSATEDLVYRLLAAGVLAEEGLPVGYSLVRETLLRDRGMDARLAAYIIVNFRRFDGALIDKKNGPKVDITGTIEKAGPEARKLYGIYTIADSVGKSAFGAGAVSHITGPKPPSLDSVHFDAVFQSCSSDSIFVFLEMKNNSNEPLEILWENPFENFSITYRETLRKHHSDTGLPSISGGTGWRGTTSNSKNSGQGASIRRILLKEGGTFGRPIRFSISGLGLGCDRVVKSAESDEYPLVVNVHGTLRLQSPNSNQADTLDISARIRKDPDTGIVSPKKDGPSGQ
jgi:hypothetical protein